MQLLSPITGILLFFPFSIYAEAIDLVCTDTTGFSVNLEINTSRSIVLTDGMPTRNVFIDKGSINFVVDLEGEEWSHYINRSTGNMIVRAPNKTILPSFKCERAKPKF